MRIYMFNYYQIKSNTISNTTQEKIDLYLNYVII